jgi:hypothetical protein
LINQVLEKSLTSDDFQRIYIGINFMCLDPRQQMVVWLEGRLDEVIANVHAATMKEKIIEMKKNWEYCQLSHIHAIAKIISSEKVMEMLLIASVENKKYFVEFIRDHVHCRNYQWMLFKLYSKGSQGIEERFWRELAFRRTYHLNYEPLTTGECLL